MSSGEYSTIPISEISINRSERIRREPDPEKISELADSIARLGLIHAPVVTRDFVLVSGETRLLACQELGWDRVTVQWSDSLDPQELLALELEENIKRYALPWQDECDAIKKYHEVQRSLDPNWNIEATAKAIGYKSMSAVYDRIEVGTALAAGHERATAAVTYSVAKNLVKREAVRARADELVTLGIIENNAPSKKKSPFLNVSFIDWVETYSGPPFNFIHCDFPYGIDADTFHQSAGSAMGTYKDDFKTYERLLDCLLSNREKLLGASGHILFWFSMRHYSYTLERLSEFFWIDPYPLIWHKSDNKGTLPDPKRGPRRIYEVAFLCSYGDRPIISPVSNLVSSPTVRVGEHMSEKSEDMLASFFKMIVDGKTRMLDPTCGSGSALRAARRLGAIEVLGLELSPEFCSLAERAWNGGLSIDL